MRDAIRAGLSGALMLGCAAAVVVAPAVVSSPALAAQPSIGGPANTMPSSVPSSITPSIDNGQVQTIAEVGNTMVAGGTFTTVAGVSHPYVLAFDATTGAIVSGFNPVLNGVVNSVIPGPVAGTVFVGGAFTQVNGVPTQFVTLLNVSDGQAVAGFQTPTFNTKGSVNDLVLRGSRLYIAGVFTTVGGATHSGLVALTATTGAVDPFLNVQLTGHHQTTGGTQGQTNGRSIDVTANGATMVVVGDFLNADGQLRDQVAMIDLSGSSAAVAPWATDRYSPACNSFAIDAYVRGVAFSPDGSYFAITAKGGGHPGTLCDAVSRFETTPSATNAQPTWVDETGGDTVWGITVTNTAVFVGGHARWMNNPLATGKARRGAVPRPGLAALDPVSGRVLAWNPGRVPLGVAVFAILATPEGLWIGSDTDFVGNKTYKRPKIAMFPWSGGYRVASTTIAGLPGRVFLGGVSGTTSTLNQVAFDGTNATKSSAATQGIDFLNWRGAFLVGNQVFYGYPDGFLYVRTFDGTTFGPAVKLDPYHDPTWANVPTGDGDTFNGSSPDFYLTIKNITAMTYYQGRVYYTLKGDAHLYSAWFSPDSGVIDETITIQTSSVDFTQADGMFIIDGTMYYALKPSKALYRVAFSGGTVSGSRTLVSGPGTGVDWTNTAMFLAAASGIPNKPPVASFTSTCSSLTCSFDATASSDPDGSIVSYAWTFGDGGTASGATPAHVYAAEGTYSVTLTVTDNSGATNALTNSVSPTGSGTTSQIAFVGAADAGGGSTKLLTVTVPAAAATGDTALLFLTAPTGAGWSDPSGVTGWQQVDSFTVSTLTTTVWVKNLVDGDSGTSVQLSTSTFTHSALSVAVYTGVDATAPVEVFARQGERSSTTHVTPTVTGSVGDWAISFWGDRSTATRVYTAPSAVTVRDATPDHGGLTTQSLLADSNGPVAAGGYGDLTATTDAATGTAEEWTIMLRPATG